MSDIFTAITEASWPERIQAGADGRSEEFRVEFAANGTVPFPQVIFRGSTVGEVIVKGGEIKETGPGAYEATAGRGLLPAGSYQVQVEGCRRADIENAGSDDWIKRVGGLEVARAPAVEVGESHDLAAPGVKIYFGIHKHMHQPFYRAADPDFWDGECDRIFGSRAGPYRSFIPMAARRYAPLPHAGLSMSWSGSLIEQLDAASREGRCGGAYAGDWARELAEAAGVRTARGSPRAEFSAFGFYHPLMPLIPGRNIVLQIVRHREFVKSRFGSAAARTLFPPETAFHVRMIPALNEAGITAVIYDSIHRYRSCRDYPYAGREEGMLPPNPSEQENPPASDWLQLHNVWAGSKIAPSLLKPEYVKYVDVDGSVHRIVAIPAERYIGNEDARGGFGALQYPDVLGQLHASIAAGGAYDPEHPPFFLLHSDGDNYGGGSESYYGENTGRMVEWLQSDPRFELTAVSDYLDRFPPDPANAVHLEPGSWSGADNGDPQFMKWFSRYNEPYSPDLNSWAVLTALQNAVHTLRDAGVSGEAAQRAERLMLTAEASDYWYWTGQDIWDQQVTDAANLALDLTKGDIDSVVGSGGDRTGPTIFPPWVTPENPGGQTWGQGGLAPAGREGTAHTFIFDVSGIRRARLLVRRDAGAGGDEEVALVDKGPYPSRTGAKVCAHLYEAALPVGAGDVRYWIEAEDNHGNIARSSLERIFLA